MEAKDLRLGNSIFDPLNQKTIQVDVTVLKWMVQNEISELNPFVYTGIPLTEEWLLNLGFEKKYKFFYQSGLYAVRHMTDGNYVFSLHFSSEDHTPLASIKYVHQLQNLYFALTGE